MQEGWSRWIDMLRQAPEKAMAELLSGRADTGPLPASDFLLAVLPIDARQVNRRLTGEPDTKNDPVENFDDLPSLVDEGLSLWFQTKRISSLPLPLKRSGHAAMLIEALSLPVHFHLPKTMEALADQRDSWSIWFGQFTITPCRDPKAEYMKLMQTSVDIENRLAYTPA